MQRNEGSIEPSFRLHPLVEQARSGVDALMRFVFGPHRREPPATPTWCACKLPAIGKLMTPSRMQAVHATLPAQQERQQAACFRPSADTPPPPVHRHGKSKSFDRWHPASSDGLEAWLRWRPGAGTLALTGMHPRRFDLAYEQQRPATARACFDRSLRLGRRQGQRSDEQRPPC